MAFPAWMTVVIAISAPPASHGIRQEAAAELLALPFAQEQQQLAGRNGEPSAFAEQRRESGAAPSHAPVGERHRHRHHRGPGAHPPGPVNIMWFDKNKVQCKPKNWDNLDEGFVYENGHVCNLKFGCEHSGDSWTDFNGNPCDSTLVAGGLAPTTTKPHEGITEHVENKAIEMIWFDKNKVQCKPKNWHNVDEGFVYENGQPCKLKFSCERYGDSWEDASGNPCEEVLVGGGLPPPRPYHDCPGGDHGQGHIDIMYFDKNNKSCKPKNWDRLLEEGWVYENGQKCKPAHGCTRVCDRWELPDLSPCPPEMVAIGLVASARDDPHLVSLAGERFDVKQPGWHSLLQVPSGDDDAEQGSLLGLDADLRAPKGASCGLYIKMVTLSGHWLDGKVVRIRPSGGGARQRQLSMHVAAALEEPAEAGGRPWAPFGGPEANESLAEASTKMVRALAVRREELGPFDEGQAFRFELLHSEVGRPPASITVSQGSHQALNVALEGMAGLGHARLGGLLGTEPHDRGLEVPTEECRESRAQSGSLLLGLVDEASDDLASSSQMPGGGREGSQMLAAWW